MSNKYLVWKDASCNGQNIEWIDMNGNDFFHFLNSNESKGRYFVLLDNDVCLDDDVIFIEATEDQYNEWYKEYCHHCYLNRLFPKTGILSLDMSLSDQEIGSLHEIIEDVSVDVVGTAMENVMVYMLPYAISMLSPKRREAITLKYFRYPEKSDSEIALLLSVSVVAFKDRRMQALRELKKYFD
jgi:hypothetical protein